MDSPGRSKERNTTIRRVLAGVLTANWVVALTKLAFGIVSGSAAVTGDGLHSFIDGGSNVLGLVAMSIAARPADDDHPYGHGKFEALASLGIGAMVGIGMLELGRMAIDSLMQNRHPVVTYEMIGMMSASLVINLTVTRIELRYGQRMRSPLLLADAQHTLSDAFVTVSVLISLILVRMGYNKADGSNGHCLCDRWIRKLKQRLKLLRGSVENNKTLNY